MKKRARGADSGSALMDKADSVGRRQAIAAIGAAAGVIATGLRPLPASARPKQKWDHETDVVCVGSGAAACTAAVIVVDGGASVLMIEKLPAVGGTTSKAGGIVWIPNNFALRAEGLVDEKEDCLRYMARYSFPQTYDPRSSTLGLSEHDFSLLEAYYDHGSAAIDKLRATGATDFKMFRLFGLNRSAPDYADHFPENKLPSGRCLESAVGAGHHGGAALAGQMEAFLRKKNVPILTETAATELIVENCRVVGVVAKQRGQTLRLRARRGVIFGTGGYAQNAQLVELHQIALYGSCSQVGSTGDFIRIAARVGAQMGSLGTAWRGQVLFEEALASRAVGATVFLTPGDSMLFLNKYGKRVVNEKRNYNDRTRIHFAYDPTREEYPNQLLFMLFDQRTLEGYGGDFPLPADVREQPFLIRGDSWERLFSAVSDRLRTLEDKSGGVALANDFAATAKASITNFDSYARAGKDLEFARGEHAYDREYHGFFSPMRTDSKYGKNPMPNVTMHPFSDTGPYYALILAAGALDTSGGPMINARAQVLDADGRSIPGLYGAGNCIAAPTRGAYYGAGGTIGPAITFGYIAATNVLREPAV